MEDFQYSVDISDRDWECFFRECEECNLLPPTLAGVDESGMSGMSDIDDSGALLAKKVQKVDVPAGISGADLPIDGPPHCEGSPVDHYLSKHGVSGMESVLSGSEEDIHLQSVNIFFERLKNLTEAERPSEPSQVKAGKNREVILKEEQCSDGQQSNMSTLPKNIPKLNSLPARGETAVGKETGRPFDAISNVNTMKKVEPSSNISTDSAASIVLLKTNKSLYPETELFIREETCTETTLNEVTRQRYRPHDSLNGLVCSKAKPHSDEVKRVGTSTLLKDGAQENLLANQLNACGKCNTNLPSNLEMVTNKWKEEPYFSVSQMDGVSIRKTEGQESSQSSSIKRKRRKKRRLSFEPPESAHGYERQGLMRSSDSEEEQNIGRGGTGLCLSEDMNLFYSNESQKNFASSLYSVSSNHPARKFAPEIKVNDLSCTAPPYDSQYQYLPKSIFRQGLCKTVSSAENNATNDKPETPLSQPVDSVMSAIDYSSNIKRTLQPCIIVQVEELTRQNKYSWFPVSDCDSATGDVDITIEKTNHGTKDIDANGCEKCDKMNHSTIGGENEQNLKCFSEVKSMTQSILPSTEINDTTLEVSQNEKRSAAKSAPHVEAGNFGRDDHTQRETESQQQIEDDCQGTDQCSSTVENTHALNAKSEQFKDNVCPVLEETSSKVNSIKLSSDCIISSPDESCFSKNPSYLDLSDIAQQTECLLKSQTLSKLDISLEKSTTTKTAQLTALQVAEGMSPCPSEKINTTGSSLRETKLSMSADLTNSLTLEIIPVSSCDTVDTDSAVALSSENITDLSGSFSSSVSQHESGGQGQPSPLILAKHEKDDATSGLKSLSLPHDSTDSKCDLSHKAEDSVAVCKSENEPEKILDSKNSVFAMSSFWSEMEKLTINDILGLRTINNPASSFPLQPSEESEEKDLFASTDSGFVAQLDESKPKQTNVCMSSVPGSVESNLESVMAVDSSSTNSAMWESVPVQGRLRSDIYPNNMMLPSVNNISQSVFCGSAQKSLRKISKNVSVHNLRALESESLSPSQKVPTLQTIDESEKIEYFSSGHVTKQEKDMASLPSSYRISVSDIFQYLFGGKQSVSSQSATDNINTVPDGDSVPESYDHFFSEFDTETFFCPLITAEDQAKDEMVPIFSCSRSANRNLQYPEAYDYFFASSASDDSSVESEEEDNSIPVRVVTRFTRKPSATKICTDAYDSFYTDSDIEQDFFWKSTFSFRNINFTASTAQKHTPSSTSLSPVPLSQTTGSIKTLYPSNALGNQDVMFPDPLLLDLQDRIYKQQLQQPFRNEDLQIAVSNPRLDAPFLPLKQSDMCLVCIAFASWVLKTANPQVGDAWKAVLLANVSALSAIRYLRKYVKMEAADSGEKLHHIASSQT